jgi:hypothetical protein
MDIVPRTQVSNPPILRVKEPSSEVQPLPIDVQIRKLKVTFCIGGVLPFD